MIRYPTGSDTGRTAPSQDAAICVHRDKNVYRNESADGDESPVPTGGPLHTWSNDSGDNGVQIDRMRDMQQLQIRTRNSLYEITVIDGRSGEILVRGGLFFPELTPAHLAGATLGDSVCRLLGIYVGLGMELGLNDRRILTTPVQTITVLTS